MSNSQDEYQPVGESSIRMRGEDSYGDSDNDDPLAKHVREENLLDAHSRGDVGRALATP